MDMMVITPPADLQRWRLVMPYAAGAQLPDDDIVGITRETLDQFFTARKSAQGADWVHNPAVVHGRHFLTFIYGEKKRKAGGSFRGIHPLGVSDIVAGRPDTARLDEVQQLGRIITGLHHDTAEDVISKATHLKPGMDINTIREDTLRLAVSGWQGPAGYKVTVERDLRSLTDPFGLETYWRYREQIRRLRHSMSETAVVVRAADKKNNTETDLEMVSNGTISDPAEIRVRAACT